MSWNYRIVKKWDEVGNEWVFGIHECYYDTGNTEPHSWTQDPVAITGNSHENLKENLESAIREAFSKKVIKLGDKDMARFDQID